MFFFDKNNDITVKPESQEHAYTAILTGDLENAKLIFSNIDSPRGRWGVSLTEILGGYLENYPTYLGIRNFYEIDLDFLIKNNKLDYVEYILGALEILSDINQEVYKYTARVMYENSLYNASKKYLDKSKEIFYNDPELHFMIAKYYLHLHDYIKADSHVKECIKILPDYYPARILHKELEEKIRSL